MFVVPFRFLRSTSAVERGAISDRAGQGPKGFRYYTRSSPASQGAHEGGNGPPGGLPAIRLRYSMGYKREGPSCDRPLWRRMVDKQELIDALNRDLANEYAAIIQYIQYAAKVRGPWRTELRAFFQQEIPDEQLHAQYLADKIAAMGGNPTTLPGPITNADSAEDMLKAIRVAEEMALRNYTERARQADEMGEIALKVQLENFISDEQNHMQEVDQILADWQ